MAKLIAGRSRGKQLVEITKNKGENTFWHQDTSIKIDSLLRSLALSYGTWLASTKH
jgi:hypothetical protein